MDGGALSSGRAWMQPQLQLHHNLVRTQAPPCAPRERRPLQQPLPSSEAETRPGQACAAPRPTGCRCPRDQEKLLHGQLALKAGLPIAPSEQAWGVAGVLGKETGAGQR